MLHMLRTLAVRGSQAPAILTDQQQLGLAIRSQG